MLNFILNKNNNWLIIINDIFQVSLVVYLIIILVEQFKIGFFSNYINLNIVLFITVISGAIVLLQDKENEKEIIKTEMKWYNYLLIISLGLASAGLIFIKLIDLNWLAYAISGLAGSIIILISYLILTEE